MRRILTGRLGVVAMAAVLGFAPVGCRDFSQHRFGGVRELRDVAVAKPTPAPTLSIPSPPDVARKDQGDPVKPATFIDRDPPRPMPVDAATAVNRHALRALHEKAAQRLAGMDGYIYRMKRREVVSGTKQPEELMLVKLRKDPFSVHIKWLGNEGKGRETIYVKGKYDNKMQVLLAAGDMPFVAAGKQMAFAPDSIFVKSRSRYPITETGFSFQIDHFGKVATACEKGDPKAGTLKYLGQVKRPEFEQQVEAAHQVIPAGLDPLLPNGGQRWWYFDATHGLPVLVITHDQNGEVEYYCHEHIEGPVRLTDDDFNPARMGRK